MRILENIVDSIFSFAVLHVRFVSGVLIAYLKLLYRYINSQMEIWGPEEEEEEPEPEEQGNGFGLRHDEEKDQWFFEE